MDSRSPEAARRVDKVEPSEELCFVVVTSICTDIYPPKGLHYWVLVEVLGLLRVEKICRAVAQGDALITL